MGPTLRSAALLVLCGRGSRAAPHFLASSDFRACTAAAEAGHADADAGHASRASWLLPWAAALGHPHAALGCRQRSRHIHVAPPPPQPHPTPTHQSPTPAHTRAATHDWWGKHRIWIADGAPPEEGLGGYSEALASSTFCLALMGDGYSSRFDDAVLHG
jgi:hypothetical protein